MMQNLHVLFVDDDSDESYLFNEALEHAGLDIQLSQVSNGNELLSFLRNQTAPDLVFMDINMPQKDGMEALKEIRKNAAFDSIPVVIYSTSNNRGRINACYASGADLFVIKPEDFDEMVIMVKKVCSIDWKNYTKPLLEDFVIEENR